MEAIEKVRRLALQLALEERAPSVSRFADACPDRLRHAEPGADGGCPPGLVFREVEAQPAPVERVEVVERRQTRDLQEPGGVVGISAG